MCNETLVTIQKLLEELLKKENSVLSASTITVFGMIGVAVLASITQFRVTKNIIRSEHDRIKEQLDSEYKLKQNENWQIRFQNVASDLLTELDPELNKDINNERKSVEQIHKMQMILNINIPSQYKLNNLISQLGLGVNRKTKKYSHNDLLQMHGDIVDSIREIILEKHTSPDV